MADEKTCPECGAELPPDAPGGLCPRCLLGAGFPSGRRHLHIRCPHCRQPVELVDDAPLVEITCPSCDSRFSLVDQETVRFDPESPATIGRFQLRERLGIGSFGSVWRAHDPELDRDVAVKIPRKDQLTATETELFLREARSAAQLRHPNVVHVHEVGREDGRVYIVSDFVAGITLADRLTAGRPAHRESASLVKTLAEALAAAHAAGVVHRDLKPSNVLLDERGEPHVTDFGLAKRDAGEITMTLEGRVLGTPAYMSPEQARGDGHAADARSDVYSLGAMLFELLTGEKPFRGNTTMLLHQVIHDDPPRPRKLDALVPRDLETICLKCLEKDPARRYQTARDLAEDLGRWLLDDPIRARPIGSVERTRRWCRRNRAVALLATTVVLSLLVGLATTLWQWRIAKTNFEEAALSRHDEHVQRKLAERRGAETQAALEDSRTRLARLFVERGVRDLDTEPHTGLPWLLEAYRTAPAGSDTGEVHRLRAGLLVADVPMLAGFWPSARDATFSPDGKRFAVAVANEAFVFELPTLLRIGPFPHDRPVVGVHFSPDGERLLTRCREARPEPQLESYPMLARVWNVRTAEPLSKPRDVDDRRVAENGNPSYEVLFAPDGERVLVAKYGMMNRYYTRGTFRMFDARTLEPIGSGHAHHHEDEWFEYVVSPDRTRVLTLRGFPYEGDDGEKPDPDDSGPRQVWDVLTGEPVGKPLEVPVDYSGADAAFRADGSQVLVGGSDGAYLFDAATGELQRKFALEEGTRKVLFHPAGEHVVVTDMDDVHVFDLETGERPEHSLWAHHGLFRLDPTGRRYVGRDGTIRDWRLDVEPEPTSFPEPHSVVFSSDGERFLSHRKRSESGSGQALGPLEVLRSADAYPLVPPWRFEEGRLPDADVFSQNGRFHAQKHDVGIWLWDLDAEPRVLRPFDPLEGTTVRDAAFDEAGRRMIVLAADGEVSLWDTVRGTPIGEPFRPEGDWQRLVFGPAGDRLALVGGTIEKEDRPEGAPPPLREIDPEEYRGDGWQHYRNVQVWEPATGRMLTPVLPHRCVSDVRFTPDGRQLVVVANYSVQEERPTGRADWDESELSVWDLESGRPVVDARRSEGEHELLGFMDGGDRLIAQIERVVSGPEPGEVRSEFETVAWSTQDWGPAESPPDHVDVEIDEIPFDRLAPRLEGDRVVVDDRVTGGRLIDLEGNVSGEIEAWATTPDRRLVAVGFHIAGWPDYEFQIRQWNLRTGEPRGTPVSERTAARYEPLLEYRPDGLVLAVADSGHLRLWDAESGLPLTAALPFVTQWSRGSEGPYSRNADANALRFTPDGERLYLARREAVWTLPLGELIERLPGDEVLAAWSRVLSAHRIDEAGAYVPIPADEIRAAAEALPTSRSR